MKEKPQKQFFFIGPATKRGGGDKDRAIRKKELFMQLEKNEFLKKNMATKLEGRGDRGW